MAIIQDAITSLMGGDTVDDWQSQLAMLLPWRPLCHHQ
jgi:hypothetical protein